ncbi:MAG: CDP-alcohol phosphatidyltransferase family protein [Chlamydiia bacterium]|nr:CDP-alcohol phosphatidyltransferase family protein [Chlamydiia bacterium]
MSIVCNLISALRGPLALLFLREEPMARVLAILLAMCTDVLDGFIARRFQCTSQFGAFFDPLMDRVFVIFGMCVLVAEGALGQHEVFTMLSRDYAIVLFGSYLVLTGTWSQCQLRALWCGKATTILQFLVLMSVTLGIPVPGEAYSLFILLGGCALVEMILLNRPMVVS